MDNIFEGKKILYVHGFGSSGQSGTVKHLREMLPEAEVIAPDLPIHPHEAMELLNAICSQQKPDLIIGTSMGGMYTEQLRGFDRIVVNPALRMDETISKNQMLGKVTFLNPREDGIQEFIMTKKLQDEYRQVVINRFQGIENEDNRRVYGLFGLEDTIVDTFDMFAEKYPNAIRFHGEHRLNDSTLYKSVLPVIRWIDEKQLGIVKPVLFICCEDVMQKNWNSTTSMARSIRELTVDYDIYFVTDAPANDSGYISKAAEWIFEQLGVLSFNRIINTNQKHLLFGDYLIHNGDVSDFPGTVIDYSKAELDSWDKILECLLRIAGK